MVPVVLAILVLIYYFYTRTSSQKELNMDNGLSGDERTRPSPPVATMEGSLSMADVPMSTSTPTPTPPPESFSNDTDDGIPLDKNPDTKLV